MPMSPDTVTRFSELEKKVDDNTTITLQLKDGQERQQAQLDTIGDNLQQHREQTRPVVDVIEMMRPFALAMQQIGKWLGAILGAVRRFGIPLFAVGAFMWAILHGETLSGAAAAFMRVIAGGK